MTPRRWYVLKRLASRLTGDGLESTWHGKQIAEAGTALAATFPHYSQLTAAGYLALEDLEDATTEELQQAGLSSREAAAVITAL